MNVDEYAIGQLTPERIEGALALSSTAGWNQRLDDWRMLLSLAPLGSFAAIHQNRIVGTAIGIDYGGFGWIAMMLVEPACRGRGLGRRLLEAAMDVLPKDRPIRLDATPMGRPLYQSYGFEDEAPLTRHVKPASDNEVRAASAPLGTSCAVRPLATADLAAVEDDDLAVFGGNRHAVLEWAFRTAPGYGYIVHDQDEAPQYCFGRRGRLFDQIGPVVAQGDAAARALILAGLRAAPTQAIVIDSFDARGTFAEWLRTCGFAAQRPLFRMRRAPASGPDATGDLVDSQAQSSGSQTVPSPQKTKDAGPGRTLVEFAILGPEFG